MEWMEPMESAQCTRSERAHCESAESTWALDNQFAQWMAKSTRNQPTIPFIHSLNQIKSLPVLGDLVEFISFSRARSLAGSSASSSSVVHARRECNANKATQFFMIPHRKEFILFGRGGFIAFHGQRCCHKWSGASACAATLTLPSSRCPATATAECSRRCSMVGAVSAVTKCSMSIPCPIVINS